MHESPSTRSDQPRSDHQPWSALFPAVNTPHTQGQEVFIKKLVQLEPHFPGWMQGNVNNTKTNTNTVNNKARSSTTQFYKRVCGSSEVLYSLDENNNTQNEIVNRSEGRTRCYITLLTDLGGNCVTSILTQSPNTPHSHSHSENPSKQFLEQLSDF